MSEWQPIETAPRDGTAIIGVFSSPERFGRDGDIVRCWYQPEFDAFISSCRVMSLAQGYSFEDGSSEQLHSPKIEKITHWMPIPKPPVQS